MQVLHVFKYLEINNADELFFNTCYHRVTSYQSIQSKVQAMKDLYADAGKEIPLNAPNPRGKSVQVNCFVDSDHAGYRETW